MIFRRNRQNEPVHRCDGCGTDRLPIDAVVCRECLQDVPEVNNYRAEPRARLRVVPTPPPAEPVPAGWDSIDETLWEGHRFVLLRHLDSAAHRITVDGVEVWQTDDPDPAAAAGELARRMGHIDNGWVDDSRTEDESEAIDDDQADEVTTRVDRRPIRDDWQRSPAAAAERARELGGDLGYRIAYRFVHPIRTTRALTGLWLTGVWWLIVRWALFTFDADETAKRVRDKTLKEGGGARESTSDTAPLTWREEHRQTVIRHLKGQALVVAVITALWTLGAARAWYGGEDWTWFWWAPGSSLTAIIVMATVIGPMLVGRAVRPAEAGPVMDSPITVHRVPDIRRNPGLILDGFEGLGSSTTSQAYKRQRERGVPAATYREDIRTVFGADNKTSVGLVCKVRTPEPADVMLNPSKHPNAVMAKAIGRPTELVKLSYNPDDEADVITVFVSRRGLKDMDAGVWPLLKRGNANYFESIPFAIDEYGERVAVCVNEKHVLAGGATGSGKSAGVRTLLCGLALDPRVRIFAYFKGGADGKPFEAVAHRLRMGNDPADLDAMADDLVGVVATAKRRQKFQENRPEMFPEGSITDEACNLGPRYADELDEHLLWPIVVMIDECRFPLMDERIAELLIWLALQARSVGVTLIMATQRPDGVTIPTRIRGQFETRLCFRVDESHARDAVMGQGVTDADPHRPGSLPRQGMGFMRDPAYAHCGSVKLKTQFLPLLPDAKTVLERAAAARQARGLLSGVAAGEAPPDPSTDTILDHIAAIPPWGDRIHGDTLTEHLAHHYAQYAEGDLADRTKRVLGLLRDHGVKPRQIEMEVQHGLDAGIRRNRMGIRRTDFDAAYSEMLTGREADMNPDTGPDSHSDPTADRESCKAPLVRPGPLPVGWQGYYSPTDRSDQSRGKPESDQ